jgi:hypothetical protein
VKSPLPLDVPPHGTARVAFSLKVGKFAKTFSDTANLLLDDGALREVPVTVEGEVAGEAPFEN